MESDFLFIIVSVTWKPAVQIRLFGHDSRYCGSLLGQLSKFYASSGIFIATRTLVRTEGLLTQLVFEHSLRIRLKAETSNENIEEINLTVAGSASFTDTKGTSVDSNSRVSQSPAPISRNSSNGPVMGKDSSTLKSDNKPSTKDKKEAQNLIGKINNLVTTDLGNIVEGRDFLVISKYASMF